MTGNFIGELICFTKDWGDWVLVSHLFGWSGYNSYIYILTVFVFVSICLAIASILIYVSQPVDHFFDGIRHLDLLPNSAISQSKSIRSLAYSLNSSPWFSGEENEYFRNQKTPNIQICRSIYFRLIFLPATRFFYKNHADKLGWGSLFLIFFANFRLRCS